MNDRLYRSRSDRMLAGVAGGLADHFDLDPSLVRVLWAILAIVSGGIFLLIYVVMAIVVPDEPLGGPSGGWSPAGSGGWSTSWPSSSGPGPGASGPGSGPIGGPAGGQAPLGGSGAAPDSAPSATPPADPPSTGGHAPPDATAAGFAAPIAGGWAPPGTQAASTPPSGTPPLGTSWPDDPRAARRAAREARRAARRSARGYGTDHPGVGGIIAGLFLVALGAYFLVRTFAPQLDVDRYWPAGLVVLGAVLIALSIRRTPGPGAP